MIAAALLVALAAAGDPCLATDAAGQPFRTCFDPGNRVEAGVGLRAGAAGAGKGGGEAALDLSAAWRWRSDTHGTSGAVEWLRDQAALEGGTRLAGGDALAAEVLGWRGVYVRRLAEPFVLLPGPRPIRLPFPFDVGVAVEVAGLRWERARERTLDLDLLRSTLLLDLARHLPGLRRAAIGPELAYGLALTRGRAPVHALVPFTGGRASLVAASADGLWSGELSARAGGRLRVPGAFGGYAEGRARLERVVLAVDDQPISLALDAGAGRGDGASRLEAALLLRLGLDRGSR